MFKRLAKVGNILGNTYIYKIFIYFNISYILKYDVYYSQ